MNRYPGIYQSPGVDLHIHSTFSDGLNTPTEIVNTAIAKGYTKIAIVDHVRRTSDWVFKFTEEIEWLKRVNKGKIELLSGIEAKVIDLDGDIDARPEFFPKVDIVLGAFHRIPVGKEEYLRGEEIPKQQDKALECWHQAMMKLLENPDVHIVAHPEAILKRYNISLPQRVKIDIAQQAASYHKNIEINRKYQVPDEEFIKILNDNGVALSFGSDSHSIDEL